MFINTYIGANLKMLVVLVFTKGEKERKKASVFISSLRMRSKNFVHFLKKTFFFKALF
jgi:hypothetical protein